MRTFSPVFQKQLKNKVEFILHTPGNFTGNILEMTVVVDCGLSKEEVSEVLPALLKTLKSTSEVFRNVRFNLTYWHAENRMENEVKPMMALMMDSYYQSYVPENGNRQFDLLAEYLKKFHARSKLIILLTNGTYEIADQARVREAMQPFLKRKMFQVVCRKDDLCIE